MRKLRSRTAYTLIALGAMVVFSVIILFSSWQSMENSRKLIEGNIKSGFASLSNYLRRGFDPQDPRLVQAYLQNYVYNHPYLKAIWIFSPEKGLGLSDKPWAPAPRMAQLQQLSPMERGWYFDWAMRGVYRQVRYFDAADDRFRFVTLAFVFDRAYLRGLQRQQEHIMLVALMVVIVMLLVFYRLVRRFWVRPIERMTAELKGLTPKVDGRLSTDYPIMEAVFLARQFNQAFERQRDLVQSLADRSIRDSLTGLYNRSGVLEELAQWLSQYKRRQDAAFAVIFVDLDGFKNINDLYGHEEGDRLLRQVAKTLQQNMPDGTVVGRLGGDEFLLLYPMASDTPQADLHLRLTQLLEALNQQVSLPGERTAHVSASIGVAIYPQDGQDASTLLRAADVAMFHAKSQGRNTYQLFDPALFAQMERQVRIGNDIEMCLKEGHFYLVYQPKVDIVSGRVYGFEALARLNHPVLGPISPGEFIPIVEQSIYSRQFGEWVMETALAFLATFEGQRPKLSINVQKRQLDRAFLEKIITSCKRLGIDPHVLTLELLESDFFADLGGDETIYALLDQHGIRLSIDDFGTGFSSLSYLEKLRVDELKVDRSFVNNIHDGKPPYVLEAVHRMADALHLDVVVEGVETCEQLKVLRNIGYRYFQGFYFSKPLPPTQARASFLDAGFVRQRLEAL